MTVPISKKRFTRFTEEPSGGCLYSEGSLFLLPPGVVPQRMTARVTCDPPACPPHYAKDHSVYLFERVEFLQGYFGSFTLEELRGAFGDRRWCFPPGVGAELCLRSARACRRIRGGTIPVASAVCVATS